MNFFRIVIFIALFIIVENTVIILFAEVKEKELVENSDKIIKDEIVRKRFNTVVKWYEYYAFVYRYKFIVYSVISIVLSASIPALNLGEDKLESLGINSTKELVSWISAIVTMVSGYLYLRNPKEKWSSYRKTAENLKSLLDEKYCEEIEDKEFLLKINEITKKENLYWEKQQAKGGVVKK
ncbi:MAG: DUF4231 domain-containing protein [Aeromonas sp.]